MAENALRNNIFPSARIGRWTVLADQKTDESGETLRLCKCDCGTYRFVRERALRFGQTGSCGCAQQEAVQRRAYDLTGMTFGDLKVLGRSNKKKPGRGVWWWCQCRCGNLCEVTSTALATGKKTHCGCRSDLKHYAHADITNRQFGRLTALYPTEKRDPRGSVVWHCRCACGQELDVPYNWLMYDNIVSCGCQKREHDQKLNQLVTRVDGTSIDYLKSQKLPASNTTGVKGVYRVRGKYMAKIVFQKRQYFLGTYNTLEEASAARHEADELISAQAVSIYEKWKRRSDEDPAWGAAHPLRFSVVRGALGLSLETTPRLEDIETQSP